MKLTVNANSIIDTLIAEVEEIHARYEGVPKGIFIETGSKYDMLIKNQWKAERVFVTASDLLGVPEAALYEAALTARRWYNKTQWEKSLPEEDATRLLQCTIEQNRKDRQCDRSGGNDYLLFMNKVISRWAENSRKSEKTA